MDITEYKRKKEKEKDRLPFLIISIYNRLDQKVQMYYQKNNNNNKNTKAIYIFNQFRVIKEQLVYFEMYQG